MFKTFPEFSKLTLGDKEEYEELIKGYPPIADISFVGLATWWNTLGYGSVSLLNGNLVIPYWLPGDDETSGLALVGINRIDESICAIFDHLRDNGEVPRLVNVPEFVIGHIQYPEMFSFKSQRTYDEYVLKVDDQYPLENMKSIWRYKIRRKLSSVEKREVVIKSLDLTQEKNKRLLINALYSWQEKNINNYGRLEQEAAKIGILDADRYGIENVCLFIDDELHTFCTYLRRTPTEAAIYCIKATSSKALGYELALHLFAKWFSEHGIKTVNLNADYGLLRLRMFMLTLGPADFYRKYTIQPNDGRRR